MGPGDKRVKNGEIRLEEQFVGGSSVDGSDTVSTNAGVVRHYQLHFASRNVARAAPEVLAQLHDQCGGSSWNRFAATMLYIANGIRTTNSVTRNGDSDSVGASAINDGIRLKTCTITASTSK